MLNKKLESIEEKLSFAGNFAMAAKKIFECVICKSVVNSPIVSSAVSVLLDVEPVSAHGVALVLVVHCARCPAEWMMC